MGIAWFIYCVVVLAWLSYQKLTGGYGEAETFLVINFIMMNFFVGSDGLKTTCLAGLFVAIMNAIFVWGFGFGG